MLTAFCGKTQLLLTILFRQIHCIGTFTKYVRSEFLRRNPFQKTSHRAVILQSDIQWNEDRGSDRFKEAERTGQSQTQVKCGRQSVFSSASKTPGMVT